MFLWNSVKFAKFPAYGKITKIKRVEQKVLSLSLTLLPYTFNKILFFSIISWDHRTCFIQKLDSTFIKKVFLHVKKILLNLYDFIISIIPLNEQRLVSTLRADQMGLVVYWVWWVGCSVAWTLFCFWQNPCPIHWKKFFNESLKISCQELYIFSSGPAYLSFLWVASHTSCCCSFPLII